MGIEGFFSGFILIVLNFCEVAEKITLAIKYQLNFFVWKYHNLQGWISSISTFFEYVILFNFCLLNQPRKDFLGVAWYCFVWYYCLIQTWYFIDKIVPIYFFYSTNFIRVLAFYIHSHLKNYKKVWQKCRFD